MDNKIAICMTTFLRNKLLYDNTRSIFDNWRDNFILLVADQGYNIYENDKEKNEDWVAEKTEFISDNFGTDYSYYYFIPFDSGLSYGRNFLVNKAKEMGCEYCIVISDAFKFNETIHKIDILTELLRNEPELAIIGLHLNDKLEWCWNIDKTPEKFMMSKISNATSTFKGMSFVECEKINNFFIAKTDVLYNVKWDNDLKLFEHLDFFWRLKNSKGANKVLFTKDITATYINNKPTIYNNYRKRMYMEFRNKVIVKYNLKTYAEYES